MSHAVTKQPDLGRRPGRIDRLLLAAAVALAAATAVPRFRDALDPWLGPPPGGFLSAVEVADYRMGEVAKARGLASKGERAVGEVLWYGGPALVTLSLGLALVTYRDPRMLRRRSRRGVGVLTTAIAGTLALFYLLNECALRRLGPAFGTAALSSTFSTAAEAIAVAVAVTWAVLALGRRWHAEPHWRDRLGRAIGSAWVAYWFLGWVVQSLWPVWG